MDDLLTLIPLRSHGKSRLASRLDPAQRERLAEAMFGDVAEALRSAGIRQPLAVIDGDPASQAARRSQISSWQQPVGSGGLNGALNAALEALRPRAVLIVAADLPALTGADIDAVLAAGSGVVVAPSRDGGTSAILMEPADAVPLSFGPRSGQRHVELARRRGHVTSVIERPGLAWDVDHPADLVRAAGEHFGQRTCAALGDLAAARARKDVLDPAFRLDGPAAS